MKTTKKQYITAIIVTILYFFWMNLKVGIRADHLISFVIFGSLYFINEKTRKLFFAICPFIIFVTVYDSLRAFPNYNYNQVHIKDLYLLEKSLFNVRINDQIFTLNEFFAMHQKTVFDLISGFSYATWIPMPLGFSLYLFFTRRKEQFVNMAFLFVLTNFLGFIVYYLYPAAPPWYVQLYGFDFIQNTACEAARLSNFDSFFGLPIYKTFYSGNANIFAAIPSLHAADPITCLLASFQLKNKILTGIFFLVSCGMWFGAVYSNHHYTIDVLAGGAVAVLAFLIIKYGFRKTFINKLLIKYENLI